MTEDDPPLRMKLLAGAILFSLVIPTLLSTPISTSIPTSTPTSVSASPVVSETNRLIIIGGNSVMALASPPSDEEVLGSLTGIPLLDRIIKAESSNRWWVKNPHSTAYGYCQMTKDTRVDAEKALGRINWKDPKQQIRACIWLYETRGTRPWLASKKHWAN